MPPQNLYRDAVAAEVRAAMARKRVTGSTICKSLGIAPSTLSRRLNGGSSFTIDELYAIAQILEIDTSTLLPRRTSAA